MVRTNCAFGIVVGTGEAGKKPPGEVAPPLLADGLSHKETLATDRWTLSDYGTSASAPIGPANLIDGRLGLVKDRN